MEINLVKMKTIKYILIVSYCLVGILSGSAQIGYQVSLLNNATGEARANERVKVTVKITDSDGNIVCEENKNETSNDFGVVSMSVGDSDTFSNADWTKLPFFIEASVDGRLIGKSQLLSVPVAEYAKKTGVLTKELLCSKEWKCEKDTEYEYVIHTFDVNGNVTEIYKYKGEPQHHEVGKYTIDGNMVYIAMEREMSVMHYSSEWNCLFRSFGLIFK